MKIGEYIRTRLGISKIIGDLGPNVYEVDKNGHHMSNKFSDYVENGEILKHSENILDLIEVGDYVNGYKVIGVTLGPAPSGKCVDIDCNKPSYESYLFEEQIYSIVTHEQFASMEYKVGE